MNPSYLNSVPHLTTALHGPLEHLEAHLLEQQAHIEHWFRQQWLHTPAPFYGSVDLRNAGFKLAPVDTNLFPAGFNNLNSTFLPLCIQSIQSAIEHFNMEALRILLIPENHTRNSYYLESVATLADILQKAGYEVRIGSLIEGLSEPQSFELDSGKSVLLEPLIRQGDTVSIKGFIPCLVLLNNDLSSGIPPILQNIQQPIIPPLQLGWSHRLKSEHFTYYKQVAKEFAQQIDIDPWLIDPLFKNCGEIDFMKKEGESCLAKNVSTLLDEIHDKYTQYGVSQEPFVVVKADAGSYGMGVMTVHSGDEVLALNRKQRTKMSSTKGGQQVSKVIMQEGVYTHETWENAVAEPVVYMIDHFVVGGFYRVHTSKGINENLNAPGAHFQPLAFAETCNSPDKTKEPDAFPNRFYAYGVVARLALLAAARECRAHPQEVLC
ncbi:MAG: glutamate--cysteine ligase [Thiotrichaceae bacterium]|nr:glutamate--cysteine ligase [Thiotrichaceae bacterium]